MNDWKEQPQLFCNGKFEIRINGGNKFQLVGCQPSTVFEGEKAILFYNMSGQIVEKPVLNCTLIARPISDMKDEEILAFMGVDDGVPHEEKCRAIWCANGNIEKDASKKVDLFLYLLSIGIYPFDQSHFKDGTVIDINTT